MAETSALTVLQLCRKAWRETQQQWEFKTVVVWVCVCVCPLSLHWTHRAVYMPEAAAVMNGYAGRPEDNVIFSQELDGNSSECLLHPEERTQVTWSAVSLHLRHRTYIVCMKTLHMHTQPFQTCLIFVLSAFAVCNIFVILHNLNHSISWLTILWCFFFTDNTQTVCVIEIYFDMMWIAAACSDLWDQLCLEEWSFRVLLFC